MNILCYKPTKAVEPSGVPATKKVIGKAPKAPRLVLSPNGTLVPVEDLLDWDFDKLNRAGE